MADTTEPVSTSMSLIKVEGITDATNQATADDSQHTQTSTPTMSNAQLSSPPPTSPPHSKSERVTSPEQDELEQNDIAHDTQVDLSREPQDLQEATSIISDLRNALQIARVTVANYALQCQMAQLQSTEAAKRMDVEISLSERETEILQHNRRTCFALHDQNYRSVHVDMYQAMNDDIERLQMDKREMQLSLDQRDETLARKDTEITSLKDRIQLMSERIRESRDHAYRFRPNVSSQTSQETTYRTPRRLDHPFEVKSPQHRQRPSQAGFDALLEAAEGDTPYRKKHTGGSLPTTPQRQPRQALSTTHYRTPSNFRQYPVQDAPHTVPIPRKRPFEVMISPTNRASDQESDGTISAPCTSDAETEIEYNATARSANGNAHHALHYSASRVLSPARNGSDGRESKMPKHRQSTLVGQVQKKPLHPENVKERIKLESESASHQAPVLM